MAKSPGDIYLNFASTGVADILSSFILNYFMKRYSIHTCFNTCIVLLLMFSLGFYFFVNVNEGSGDEERNSLIAVLIMNIRMVVNSCFFMSYLLTSALFPTLLRSKAFSINNFISRPVTMLAPLLIRMENPLSLLIFVSFVYFIALNSLSMEGKEGN